MPTIVRTNTSRRCRLLMSGVRQRAKSGRARLACLKAAPRYAVSKLCGDATKFAKVVSDTRNLLTHFDFEEDENDDLYRAFRASLYLTYKMTVLFCILEAQWLRIPLDNLPMMLENNTMAIGAKRPIQE
jgi:hypothetical protein